MVTFQIATSAVLLWVVSSAQGDTRGKVHGNPESLPALCQAYKPHELCFGRPSDAVARAEYLSEPFYAIILHTIPRCTVKEEQRLAAQTLFPRNKVFASRFQCDDDVEENVTYTNVDEKHGFLAVYGGASLSEARKRLADIAATGRYKGANIRRMQAKLVYS